MWNNLIILRSKFNILRDAPFTKKLSFAQVSCSSFKWFILFDIFFLILDLNNNKIFSNMNINRQKTTKNIVTHINFMHIIQIIWNIIFIKYLSVLDLKLNANVK